MAACIDCREPLELAKMALWNWSNQFLPPWQRPHPGAERCIRLCPESGVDHSNYVWSRHEFMGHEQSPDFEAQSNRTSRPGTYAVGRACQRI